MARTIELRVPKLGDFSDVPIVELFMTVGKVIGKNDPLVSLESEKAVIEVPAPETGTVLSVGVAVGDKVSQGTLLGTMELAADESAVAPAADESAGPANHPQTAAAQAHSPRADALQTAAPRSDAPHTAAPRADAPHTDTPRTDTSPDLPESDTPKGPASPQPQGLYHASPSVRLFARELGADLALVRGTGPKGRIRREDLTAFVKARLGEARRVAVNGAFGSGELAGRDAAGVPAKSPPVDPESFRKYGDFDLVPVSRIKRISGPRLAASWQTIPHVTQFDEVDITELEAFRNRSNNLLAQDGVKLTVLAFAIKAVVATLKAFPVFNSSLLPESGEFVMKKYYNIGFAVSTDSGLVVPSMKNADAKSLREIALELKGLSLKAAAGKLSMDDMTGSSFTISSLGGIGGTAFTPIINPPEVAILGLSRASMKPVWDEKTAGFLPRLVLPFSLSYDHRAVDGAEGARFCRHFAGLMGDMAALLI